ncbi:hypothetical protein HZS_5025 [Henneguya salminicola]|nr:hypothetical protein HZS_5025 [Henneguya salminicola]
MPDIYTHYTVNHSVEFVHSILGGWTNTIEGTLNGIKTRIAPRNRTSFFGENGEQPSAKKNGEQKPDGIIEHLAEFQWRRKNSRIIWDGFIDSLKTG